MSQTTSHKNLLKAFVLPGLPHLLLAADKNPGWKKVRNSFDQVKASIDELNPDVLLVYSTYWPSILGHQVQTREMSEWTHVDDQFHALGSIPYKIKGDKKLGESIVKNAKARGLYAKTVDYNGFPIDTGSVVVHELINKDARRPMVIVSSNVYSDRAETVVFGKAAVDALNEQGKTAVAIVVTSLSNRLHTRVVDPKEDHIHSLKDQEWNEKFMEFLGEGRLEDASQLSRQFHKEARVHKVANFKPFWWLSAVMGANNLYAGEILSYAPVCGTGAAVIRLTPSNKAARDLEFDENDPEKYSGERNVLGGEDKDSNFEGGEGFHPSSGMRAGDSDDTFGRAP
tara:strand:+ start:4367 stop:5389 length:1023 start_codon:yes stop_codon:yes gene_type:complete